MKNAEVFLDTSALLALINADDSLHADAMRVRDDLNESGTVMVCSEWVLSELLNHTAARHRRRAGLNAADALLRSPRTIVEVATSEDWHEALALYRRRADKEWSLIDCTSMLICERRGIKRVFTHDRHFRQARFDILL